MASFLYPLQNHRARTRGYFAFGIGLSWSSFMTALASSNTQMSRRILSNHSMP